jgi:two-component sensor histidine kinase/tetratricopeptide (TPR) repeat protein
MRKLLPAVILLFTTYLTAKAQNPSSADATQQLLSDLKKINADSVHLNILLKLGSYYLYKPGELKSDLDSADLFLEQAKELSAKVKISKIQTKVLFLQAEVLFERGNQAKARIAYLQAIDNYTRSGEMEEAALAWIAIADRVMYSDDSTAMLGIRGYEHALNIYTKLNNKEKEAGVLKLSGDRLFVQGKLDESENELLKALSIYKSIGYKKLHYTYDLLAGVSTGKGDFNKALYYSLEMIKSLQATGDTAQAYLLYSRIAAVYGRLNEDDKSIYWYKRALLNDPTDPGLFYDINNILVGLMIKEGKTKEALEFLLRLIKKQPPADDWAKLAVALRLGECYGLLGKDDLAEKYDQQAVIIAEGKLPKQDGLTANKRMADFYFSRKRYGQAGIYLHRVLAFPRGIGDVEMIRGTYHMLFRVDSATGNYLSAIKNYQQYKLLTDSIFTVAKAKQITQLQLQFEKDQKVQQLEDKAKLQQAELQHAGAARNLTISGAGLLLLSLAMVYRRYRQKQHSNRLLQAQRQEINLINQSLQLLVTEKDTLLKEKDTLLLEKDWLLKEVHHRVKNNLHTVICLLESQEIYLENDALEAIEICQRRIYAMSLIHQKLYQSEDIEMVDMCLYIKEFVQYLADSFGPPANIRINSGVEPANLGISQAIPLGLILNEAVTNAFKYAFPNNKPGEIFIGLKQAGKNLELLIADNGIGIQHRVEEGEPPNSLGIELMRGLTRDLKGNITFDTGTGTRIAVIFEMDSLDGPRRTGIITKPSSIAYDN